MAVTSPVFYYDKLLDNKGNNNNLAYLVSAGGEKVLAKGFVTSDSFGLGVKNHWGGVDGVPGIGGTIASNINSLRSKAAGLSAYAGKAVDVIRSTSNKFGLSDWVEDSQSGILSFIGNALKEAGNRIKDAANFVDTISQNAVESADTYMKLFNGTDIEIPLSFDEYLITDSIEMVNKTAKNKRSTDICLMLSERLRNFAGYFDSNNLDEGLLGYTKAPGGFKTTLKGLKAGAEPEGTYALYYNGYRFRGLLVDSLDIEVSTAKVRVGKGKYRPLYFKIHYNLTPAVKHSTEDFVKWFTGMSSVKPK